MVKQINTWEEFEKEVLNSKIPAVVDFWAEWCGPCKLAAPVIDELSEELKDKIIFFKVNVEKNSVLPQKYEIRSVPTFLVFNKGELAGSFGGYMGKDSFKKQLDKLLS